MSELPDLDEVVHQKTRLAVLTMLAEAGSASFTYLRDSLGLSDGNLSRHLRVLEEHGLVRIDKSYKDRKPHTQVAATKQGRAALERYLSALEEMIGRVRGA
jgi:DNA-binding MarR family transcriptional regulator